MAKSPVQKVDPAAVSLTVDPSATAAAYEKYGPAARALPVVGLVTPTTNATSAVAIGTAGALNVLSVRAEAGAKFKKVPWAVVERIAEVGLATQHADMLVRLQEDDASSFGDLLPRVNELRGLLLDDLDLLVRRKLVPAKLVADIRKGDNTMRDKANDLHDCAEHYTAQWEKLSRRSSVSNEEVKEATELATSILARLGALHVTQATKPGALTPAEMRRRMFTLLDRDYDVVRRLGSYLFWDRTEGWRAFTPSLWAGRATGPAAVTTEGEKKPDVV